MSSRNDAKKIFAISKNQVFLAGIKTLIGINRQPLVWAGSHPPDPGLVQEIRRHHPHVAIADEGWLSDFPNLLQLLGDEKIPLLQFSHSNELAVMERLLKPKMGGLVCVNDAIGSILSAIETVAQHRTWLPPAVQERLISRTFETGHPLTGGLVALTPRQIELVTLLLRHPEAKTFALANLLGIQDCTFRNQLSLIYKKLNLRGRIALTLFAQQHGFR